MPILVASFPLSNEADFYSRLFFVAKIILRGDYFVCRP